MQDIKRIMSNKKLLALLLVVLFIIVTLISNFVIGVVLELFGYYGGMISGTERALSLPLSWKDALHFHSDHLGIYGLVFMLIFVIIVKIGFNVKMNFDDLDKGQHGTREFERLEELKKQYRVIPASKDEYEGQGGVIISGLQENNKIVPLKSKPYRLLIDESPVHTMCIGITRSGKGETFVVPMLDVLSRAKEKPSLVVNDPKGELAGASHKTLIERGYEVHVFNLIQQHMGMGFNPLQLVIDAWKNGDTSLAEQYANSIGHSLYFDPNAKEAFWGNSASSLVKAIILALTEDSIDKGEEEKVNMYSVANFLSTLGSDNDEQAGTNALDQFFQARDENNPARLMYATSNFAGGNTRSSIFSIAMDKLQIFTSEPNARLTSYNSMNLTDVGFGKKPVAVFMVTPDYDSSNHVLASIFVSQLYRVNAEKATMESGKMERHVHFMLDEFGNMPSVEGMAGMVTVGAGRGFRFHLIVQAYSQIKSQYGEESETIIGNCSNQIYILTQDKATAEQYSALLGTKTITDVSRSGHLFSTTKSHNESVKERPLLMPDELMQLKEGESVVIRVNKRQDMERNKIVPKPIYNKDETAHKFRYEYLADDFDTDISVLTLPITSTDYYELNLGEIIFTSKPKKSDQYLPIRKIRTPVQVKALKSSLNVFSKTSGEYETIGDWSTLQLLSHIVHELRPDLKHFVTFSGKRHFKLTEFCSQDVIDEWTEILQDVIKRKGVGLTVPVRRAKED